MSTKPTAGRVRKTYEFIKAHRGDHGVQMMCRLLGVAPSGYYEWLKKPMSDRAQENARLLRLIRASFEASQGVYGAPRVFLDLREAGETCSKHRVARLIHGVMAISEASAPSSSKQPTKTRRQAVQQMLGTPVRRIHSSVTLCAGLAHRRASWAATPFVRACPTTVS